MSRSKIVAFNFFVNDENCGKSHIEWILPATYNPLKGSVFATPSLFMFAFTMPDPQSLSSVNANVLVLRC